MAEKILDIDLASFSSSSKKSQKAVIDGARKSLETGFVYATSTVSEALIDEAYDILGRFFSSEQEFKDSHAVPGSYGSRGYTETLVETAVGSDTPDWKEMFNWGTKERGAPPGHPMLRDYGMWYHETVYPDIPGAPEVLGRFHDSLVELQREFLRVIALGVGASSLFFEEMTSYAPHLSRAINYPPMGLAPGENYIWADAHADINLVTALPRATARGLQIMTEDGWVDAAPPQGHVILNTGIMLERLTNGVIPSGWHRVLADPDQKEGRMSVVQFCHPRPSTILSPLPSTTADRPCRHSAVSAEDLLSDVIWQINLAPAEMD